MTKNRLKVAFIIPAYNEASVIGSVIENLNAVLASVKYNSRIIVIDDGSKDDTANIARKAGAQVIEHILNTGSGGATATGLSFAQQNDFDIAVTLDADGQHSSGDVIEGVDIMIRKGGDLLIGSRLIDSRGMSKTKKIGNKGLSFITYALFGVNITDSQSGLRVFSKNSLNKLRWKTNGYEFCSEMLWRAKQLGLVIYEYPISAIYTEYSKSKGQNNWNAINITKSLIKRRLLEMFE